MRWVLPQPWVSPVEEVVALYSATMEDCVSQLCDLFAKVIFALTFNKVLSAKKKELKCSVSIWFEIWENHICPAQGDGISPLVQSSVLGKGVKHRPPPIKMPSGSGSSSSGTSSVLNAAKNVHLTPVGKGLKLTELIKAVKTCSWKNSVTESCMAAKTRPDCFKAA